MPSRRVLLFLFALVLLLVVALTYKPVTKKQSGQPSVQNFTDCQKRGYPIMENKKPRICVAPDGNTFAEQAPVTRGAVGY